MIHMQFFFSFSVTVKFNLEMERNTKGEITNPTLKYLYPRVFFIQIGIQKKKKKKNYHLEIGDKLVISTIEIRIILF